MNNKKQRSYTAQYRADAVVLAKAKSGSLPKVPIDPEPKASLKLAERLKILEQENAMLKSENIQLIKERKILEDATIFFAARQKK